MPNATKIERVAELKEQIESANALLLTEYRGLTVEEITELRRSLRDVDASLAVIKNTVRPRYSVSSSAFALSICSLSSATRSIPVHWASRLLDEKQPPQGGKAAPSMLPRQVPRKGITRSVRLCVATGEDTGRGRAGVSRGHPPPCLRPRLRARTAPSS